MSTNTMNFSNEKFTKLLMNSVHDAEQALQIECVLKILTDTLEQINLATILPQILENADFLPEILYGTNYQRVIPMVNDFVKRCTYITFENTSFLDHKLVRLFDYLQENHKMFSLFPSEWSLKMDTDSSHIIDAIKILYDLTVTHIYTSPEDEISKERRLHTLYNENKNMKAGIKDMKSEMEKEKLRLRWKIIAKAAYMQQCTNDINNKHLVHRYFVKLFKQSMIRKVLTDRRLNVKRKKNLNDDVIAAKNKYELLLKTFKKTVNVEYKKRDDAIYILQDKIKTYDRTMGMKIVRKLELQKKLTIITDKIKIFENDYHIDLRKCEQYEKAEQERLEYGVTNFVINCAVKKIQFYWRNYRERRSEIEKELALKTKKTEEIERKQIKKEKIGGKMKRKKILSHGKKRE